MCEKRRGKFRYANGIEISPFLSGVSYAISVFALLKIRHSLSSNLVNTVEEDIFRIMKCRSRSAVNVFVDLKSIWATIRREEKTFQVVCIFQNHDLCGNSKSKSKCRKIRSAVISMQSHLRLQIFQFLLFGATLPNYYQSSFHSLYDDIENRAPGYWAFSDERNASLVKECTCSSFQAIDQNGVIDDFDEWCKKARNLFVTLNTVIHFSGGTPSRGKELSAMSSRNTHQLKRSFFITSKELMVIPAYFKTRSVHRGSTNFISRHLDPETTYLFISY